MAKLFVQGVVEGFQTLTSKAGKVYGYNLGISSSFTNKYGQPEKRIVDVRYNDQTRAEVERMAAPLVGKEVYVEVWASGNEFNGRVNVEYNFQRDSKIIDANLADPYGEVRKSVKAA
ncbi:hypothetical protein EXU30_00325 [Shewanella maritima]|uniref:Uncharacterized protein n=1 Tax=Shewanella maritima TaxID=2520507 RepID=A0A411PCM5_9GAMM|nr:hypothetical protein [Shewanella maritima]QBF81279.1 hypothetical protein EXU30_00145 [Shewanella maritima]QBF81287.1 hypothetical protein EXU30_00185 [Shewanella maritima]QBF81296.1 hypothetical protein EXU30_00230 [Shewanella maritima]QBF81306.1 hypothetical protein EXU30_00280 [Shewanella maritima]QBF81315.1 hypothetical protein EXU30_00325 [Shewanella maritima]